MHIFGIVQLGVCTQKFASRARIPRVKAPATMLAVYILDLSIDHTVFQPLTRFLPRTQHRLANTTMRRLDTARRTMRFTPK